MPQEDLTSAIGHLKETLPEMSKRSVPATPNNYAVWYEYVRRGNEDLCAEIERIDSERQVYSDEINTSLYERFIADEKEAAFNTLNDSVRIAIQSLLLELGSEGKGLHEYAETLSDVSDQISSATNVGSVRDLVNRLVEETKKREEQTLNMQESLEAMASEMKKLRAEVSRLNSEATTDALTKVKNRRAFDIEIENLSEDAKREHSPLSLLLIDIDHFKQFNDKFGHIIGDKVLRFVATLLKQNLKGADCVARFGGEEFAILLPETDYNGALVVAENIRKRMEQQTLSDSKANIELGTITVSVGAALYQYGESTESFIQRADECMYDAKRGGRNRVVGELDRESAGQESNTTFI